MITRWKFGTPRLNGRITKPETKVSPSTDVQHISLEDTVPGNEIRWVLVNGIFIADRCVLTGVSWDNLDNSNLASGYHGVNIDGLAYRIRLLKLGDADRIPNEWEDALNEAGDSDAIWHWRNQFFWGWEALKATPEERVARGFSSPQNWNHWPAPIRAAYIAWRPVLAPDTIQPVPELISEKLLLRTNTGEAVAGLLADITDYDFLLEDAVIVQAGGSRKPPAVKRCPRKMAAVEKDALVMAQQYV